MMKTKTSFLIIFPILIVFCSQNLNAQTMISSDSLIGEWEYLTSGDTIKLINHNIDKNDYKKWIFKADNKFIEKSTISGDDKHKGLNVESIGVKWFYDPENEILKIDRGKSLSRYKLNSFDNKTIKLIIIK